MNETSHENLLEIELNPHDLPDLTHSLFSDFTVEEAPRTHGEKYVVFFSAGELYAVSSKQIAEVVNPLKTTPLPFVPAWLVGIAHLRGEIISVLDLQKLRDKKTAAPLSVKSKLIVLHGKTSKDAVALTADRLSEVVHLSNEQIQFTGDDSSFLLGTTTAHHSGTINLLNIEKILSLLEFTA